MARFIWGTPSPSLSRGKQLRVRRDIFGTLLGLLVFLGGIALLLFTFRIAYDMFTVPPVRALGLIKDQPVDLGSAGSNLVGSLLKVLLLIVMALVGSLIANRGIQLYTDSRGHIHESAPHLEESDDITRFTAEGGKEAS